MDVKPNILVDQRNSMIFHHMRNIITNRRITTKLDPNYSYSYEEKEVIRVWERRGVFLEFSVARRVKICTDHRRSARGKKEVASFPPSLSLPFSSRRERARVAERVPSINRYACDSTPGHLKPEYSRRERENDARHRLKREGLPLLV